MQVSKKKTSQGDHVKPVFKNITSQAELKREIVKYLKQKELDLENKLVDGIQEAKEDMQREKIRKKEENIERNKAKEYLNTQALEISGFDSQYLNELYEIAEKHPREFNEIMKKSKIDELLKEFDEYKREKEDEDIIQNTTPEKLKKVVEKLTAASGNDTEEMKIGADIEKTLSDFKSGKPFIREDGKSVPTTNRNLVSAAKNIPGLRAILQDLILKNPDIKIGDLGAHMKSVYGITYNIHSKDDLAEIKKFLAKFPTVPNKAVSVTGPSAAPPAPTIPMGPGTAAAPPAPATPKKKGFGLSGYISGKVIKDVLKRFNVLVGEASSGNTSPEIKAEIFDIVDFLYKNRKITKPQMNQVVRAFRLDKP